MFEWIDSEVGDAILSENKDRIVRYPKEDREVFAYGDLGKKHESDSIQQVSSWVNDELHSMDMENSSGTNSSDLASRFEMDSWPDLPSLSPALAEVHDNGHILVDTIPAELLDGYSESSDLEKVRVHLDCESNIYVNENDDKGSESFLGYDWAKFGDFDDFDKIFRNDSMFEQEIVNSAQEFMSTTSELIGSDMQSLPATDLSVNKEQHFEKEFFSFQNEEDDFLIRRPEEEMTKPLVRKEREVFFSSQISEEYSGLQTRKDKSNGQRNSSKSRRKEAASKNTSQKKSGTWSQSIISQEQQLPSPRSLVALPSLRNFQNSPSIHQTQTPDNMGHPIPVNNLMIPTYGYPAHLFSSVSVLPHPCLDQNQRKPDSSFPSKENDLDKREDSSKRMNMTPQEKINKLRRRQQMQAMLAIQQQQQQLVQQSNSESDNIISQISSQKNESQEVSRSTTRVEESGTESPETKNCTEKEGPQKFVTPSNDQSFEEKIIYDLQNALRKLDVGLRLCIRDSLFRLARSAMDRQNASDRNSTNKSSIEDKNIKKEEAEDSFRFSKLPDAETDTNPIDRTVAHLLFHQPLESSCSMPTKYDLLHSPVSPNPSASSLEDELHEKSRDDANLQPSIDF